jgi:POT family proton-dependent oligopeptide transporter
MSVFQVQPKGLPYLFFTEMWERFGFYVVQGMLVLYMSKAFGLSDNESYTITGIFTALAYIAPFAGGYIADRVLGFKTSIIIGGIFLALGYAVMALPWSHGFYLSLATIIIGSGLFKPNVSSLLGSLYEPGDPRREAGFTLFYIGINLGVLLAGVSSGFVKDYLGWHAGFALASVGLLLGVITFVCGHKHLAKIQNTAFIVAPASAGTKYVVIAGSIISIFLISELLQTKFLAQWLLPVTGIVLLTYLLILTFKQNLKDRQAMLALIALISASVIFWMIFLQIFFSASLFIERLVDRRYFNFTIPSTVFYALESMFVILLGPIFAWSWQTLGEKFRNPAPFLKFILAIVFVGLAFLVLSISTHYYNNHFLVSPFWILLSYCLLTIGEMFLSPIGLSAVTTLSPRKFLGMMMGMWFVAAGYGGQFAGLLAKLSNIPDNVSSVNALAIYGDAFMDYALIAFAVSALLLILYFNMRKLFVGAFNLADK